MKEFILNKELNEKMAKWITKAMEYYIEIRIRKLVSSKGQWEKINSSYDVSQDSALVLEDEQPIEVNN